MWHVSIALVRRAKPPISVSLWSPNYRREALVICNELLAGVGVGKYYVKQGDVAIHLRRMISDEELKLLTSTWLLIPAVDMAG